MPPDPSRPSTFCKGSSPCRYSMINPRRDSPSQPVDPGHANESPRGPTRAPSSAVRTWLLVVAAGLLAGLAGFGIGEVAPSFFPISTKLPPDIAGNRRGSRSRLSGAWGSLETESAALAYGGLGTVLGLALGVAGGLARRSPRAAIAAGVLGLVLGGAAGAGDDLAFCCPSITPPAPPPRRRTATTTWPWPCGLMAASGWPSGPRPGWPSASDSAAGLGRPEHSSVASLAQASRRRSTNSAAPSCSRSPRPFGQWRWK